MCVRGLAGVFPFFPVRVENRRVDGRTVPIRARWYRRGQNDGQRPPRAYHAGALPASGVSERSILTPKETVQDALHLGVRRLPLSNAEFQLLGRRRRGVLARMRKR